jgi:hypothetical protein
MAHTPSPPRRSTQDRFLIVSLLAEFRFGPWREYLLACGAPDLSGDGHEVNLDAHAARGTFDRVHSDFSKLGQSGAAGESGLRSPLFLCHQTICLPSTLGEVGLIS